MVAIINNLAFLTGFLESVLSTTLETGTTTSRIAFEASNASQEKEQ